jgi:hypothetical protein
VLPLAQAAALFAVPKRRGELINQTTQGGTYMAPEVNTNPGREPLVSTGSPVQEPAVLVTGEERIHPAFRLLARAAITLARLQIRAGTGDTEPTPAPGDLPDSNTEKAAPQGGGSEATHE